MLNKALQPPDDPGLALAYDLGFRAFGEGHPQRYSGNPPGCDRSAKMRWLKEWLRGWRAAERQGPENA
jgi:hypothetical protein